MKMNITRRKLLTSSAVVAVGHIASKAVAAEAPSAETRSDKIPMTDEFTYEVNYTDAEWRERLTEAEYAILREGGTEEAKSSPLWRERREGLYHCKGCELTAYESKYKIILSKKGWVFFEQSNRDAVLTGVDFITHYSRGEPKEETIMEAHCRRCGSHLGHLVSINNGVLHCINGAALNFKPTV